MPLDAAAPPSGRCTLGGGGGTGGGGAGGAMLCQTTGEEICGGTTYQVACACPQGTCACFGTSTTVVNFAGCPACPSLTEAFSLCNFPH